ncbi:MAG: B12-binding domain-containing radical SAM protein [Candidatus Omnitrophica bacterium]|nr:B12-binding domain-containing radical SAM protein [Candidatus Omnitrophota bacterium]
MRVLLINPPSKDFGKIQQKCFVPISLLYLASSLLEVGYQTTVLDVNALGLKEEETLKKIKELNPDLIGIPLFSDIFFKTISIIKLIKTNYPQIKILLGGPHASALPQRVLEEIREVDYILKGEAEESIVKFCHFLEGKLNVLEVPGLYFREDDKILSNKENDNSKNLDKLPPPAKYLLKELYKDKKYYLVLVKERPIDTIVTSRGCPFGCRFCSIMSKNYRALSAENVLKELIEIYNKGITNIDIADANFTFDRDRVMRIFKLIQKEKLNIKFRFKSRADSIDKELVIEAKKAGAYLISLGIESGSNHILKRMNKGIKIEQAINSCELIKKVGLKLNTGWIIGFLGETEETIKETAKLILKIKPTTASINILVPYPGTSVYEEAKATKSLMGDWSLEYKFTPWVKLAWTRSYEDLKKALKWVKKKVYLRPYYVYNFSKEIAQNLNTTLAKYAIQELMRIG